MELATQRDRPLPLPEIDQQHTVHQLNLAIDGIQYKITELAECGERQEVLANQPIKDREMDRMSSELNGLRDGYEALKSQLTNHIQHCQSMNSQLVSPG